MLFGLLPILLLFLLSTFFSLKGKKFIDSIDLKLLTYFHTIRVLIEIILTLLYHKGLMSVLVTFEGTNFDVLSGIYSTNNRCLICFFFIYGTDFPNYNSALVLWI